MSIVGFKNSNIYLEGAGIKKTSITLTDSHISAIGSNCAPFAATLKEGLIIVPGFIDEHIHGANGSDTMDATQSAFTNISKSILAEGTTSFLFTTMTMDKSHIFTALKAIKEYLKQRNEGAIPLGIHLEGPFISKCFSGAQNPNFVLPQDTDLLHEMITASGNNIKIVTFSYDVNNNSFLDELLNNNIIPSIGHTDCCAEDALTGFEKGIKMGTHVFNAMKGIHHRDIGTSGALLLNKKPYCELICDLHHISENAIRLIYKCKGKNKIILVTDSMEAKYLPDGEYTLGGNTVYAHNGIATLSDGTLAGSVLKMNEAIRNIKTILNISLEEAIDMATITPAKNLGFHRKKGSIRIGKDADFAIIDKDINVIATIVGGEIRYMKGDIFI